MEAPVSVGVFPLDHEALGRDLRHAAIDRMATAARRHIRYERVKALQMIARFRVKPITADYTQRMVNAFWREAAGSFAMSRSVNRDYTDAHNAEMRSTVVVRFPNRAAN